MLIHIRGSHKIFICIICKINKHISTLFTNYICFYLKCIILFYFIKVLLLVIFFNIKNFIFFN